MIGIQNSGLFQPLSPYRPSKCRRFIRERMFRLGKELPIIVVSPQPWFPGQRFYSSFKPYFRPSAPQLDIQSEVNIIYPKFFRFPAYLNIWMVCSWHWAAILQFDG